MKQGDARKLRVVLLIPTMKHGGAERAASRLYDLLGHDFDVSLVVFDSSDAGYGMKDHVFVLGHPSRGQSRLFGKAVRSLARARALRRYNQGNQTDVTYSFGDTANLVNVFSGGKGRKIISIRGYRGLRLENSIANILLFRPLLRFMARAADATVTVSEEMAQTFGDRYGASERLVAIPNGYDVDALRAAAHEECDETLMDRAYVLAVGTLRREKRFDHLLRSYAASSASHECDLLICGSDPFGYEPRLRSLATELGVGDSVKILPFQDNPFPLMSKAVAFVTSSESEGFPNVLVEAMALGTPVISTDCPTGPREILDGGERSEERDNVWGILVEAPTYSESFELGAGDQSTNALANALSHVVSDDTLRTDLSRRASERASQFGFGEWRDKHLTLVASLFSPGQVG